MVLLKQKYSLSGIGEVAGSFWEHCRRFSVITFNGEMGAGKTTFISSLCDHLDVTDHVSSPTFALVNEYSLKNDGKQMPLYHIDWYRLKDAEDAVQAGMEDYLSQAAEGLAVCLIEWPERAATLLPMPYVSVSIEVLDDVNREMTVPLRQ